MRTIILQNNTNSFYTKFYPSLQSFTGCTIATLIVGKLEFWFENPKYKRGFFKFAEPCGSPLYREGDSWSEEVGVSRRCFNRAFDIIGVRYKSKSAYLNAEDKFQGKFYASYHDRKTNRTYYVRNHEFVSEVLSGLFKKKKTPSAEKQKGTESEDCSSQIMSPKTTSSDFFQCRSRNDNFGRSSYNTYKHKKTSSLESTCTNKKSSPPPVQLEHEVLKMTEGMVKIWKEEVGELGVPSLSNGLLTRLQTTFRESFSSSLDSWKGYCQMISSSKFLMGEAQNKFFKKAWITWAINPENIDRVKGGGFKLGDRQTKHDKAIESIDLETRNGEYKKHQVEMQIANIKSEIRDKRRNIVKERIKNLSEQERLKFEKEFEFFLVKENNSMTEEFRKSRWNGIFISAYFDSFVEEKTYAELFKNVDETHDEKIVQASGLLEILKDVRHDLDQVKQKKRKLELRAETLDSANLDASPQNSLIDSTFDSRVFNELEKAQNIVGVSYQRSLSWD